MQYPALSYQFKIHSPLSFRQTGNSEVIPYSPTSNTADASSEYYLILVTQNTLRLHTPSFPLAAASGEYLLLPSAVWNPIALSDSSSDLLDSDACSFRWLCFSCPTAFSLSERIGSACPPDHILLPSHGTLPHPQKIILLLRQLQDSTSSDYAPHYRDYLSTLILCEVFHQQQMASRRDSGFSEQSDAKKQLYFEIIDYISGSIDKDLKVIAIAKHFGYNEKYISRYFKELSGLSLKQYILRQKIERANVLLGDTKLTITCISRSLGFSDYHNFIRAYKSITAMTPSEYRKLYIGGPSSASGSSLRPAARKQTLP